MISAEKEDRWSDEHVELFIGNLLRFGVILAAAVAAVGGVLFLATHGLARADYRVFRGEPASLTSVRSVLAGAFTLRGESVIQLGLLLLIATPVARVALSLVAFAKQHDRTYMVITTVVLGILIYSLTGVAA